jgi:hypothetical protein
MDNNVHKNLLSNFRVDLGIDRVILKPPFKKYMKVGIGFIWLRISYSGGLL